MGYEWPPWALEALRGIEPHEVVQALGASRRWPRRAQSPEGVVVVTIWARTEAGRLLIVGVRRADDWTWQILGARDPSGRELAQFERWEAERNV